MPNVGLKEFVIKHNFVDILTKEENEKCEGVVEFHCGFLWRISGHWTFDPDVFHVYLECLELDGFVTLAGIWNSSNIGFHSFSKDKAKYEMVYINKHYVRENLIGSNFLVELTMSFLMNHEERREKMRNFDESVKKFSDVVLVVGDEKFYVCKMFLASHSSYFEALFFRDFDETSKSEVEIKDVEPCNFQNFLELINGETMVDDDTVDGLLHLSDFFDSKTVFRRCETFLVEKSMKSAGDKIQLAIQYNMKKLTEKCVSDMKTVLDIHNIVPDVEKNVEDSIWKILLLRSLSLE